MEERTEKALKFANIHAQARSKARRSQEYMSLCLGVSKKTVSNWEKGISSPTFFQSLEWFKELNTNPFPYYMSVIYPQKNIHTKSNDEEIEAAFNDLMNSISTNDKRALLFLFYGEHGSSPHSVLQMILAHLHTPIASRLANAFLISHVYELNHQLENVICPENILPDMDDLKKSIEKAKCAVMNKENSYSNIE